MKQNDKNAHTHVINILLPVMLMTLTSLLLLNTINLTYVQQRRRNTKFNFIAVRLLSIGHYACVCVYIYVYNHDNGQMHRFFFFFSFLSPFFSLVLITRATASVYSHEADGGTLHLILDFFNIYVCISVCLIYRKKNK